MGIISVRIRIVRSHAAIAFKLLLPLILRGILVIDKGTHIEIHGIPHSRIRILCVFYRSLHLMEKGKNRSLNKNIVTEAYIPMQEGHKSDHARSMDGVVRRVALRLDVRCSVVRSGSDAGKRSCEQVVNKRAALRSKLDGALRQENIVVHQRRSVGHLYKKILSQGAKEFANVVGIQSRLVKAKAVVIHQVLRHAGSLRLPVKPDASRAVVNPVSAENNINGRVHLDSADFRTGKVLLVVDVVNVVVLNDREHTSQMTDNTGLSTVMNRAAANDVTANVLLVPVLIACLQNAVTLRLGTIFIFPLKPAVVIAVLQIFSK
ncbi:unknown [Firmicutes bacterium CAG:791]|nr:unknown [Firmicutes bacterium CAG:791]